MKNSQNNLMQSSAEENKEFLNLWHQNRISKEEREECFRNRDLYEDFLEELIERAELSLGDLAFIEGQHTFLLIGDAASLISYRVINAITSLFVGQYGADASIELSQKIDLHHSFRLQTVLMRRIWKEARKKIYSIF